MKLQASSRLNQTRVTAASVLLAKGDYDTFFKTLGVPPGLVGKVIKSLRGRTVFELGNIDKGEKMLKILRNAEALRERKPHIEKGDDGDIYRFMLRGTPHQLRVLVGPDSAIALVNNK